MMRSLYSGVSGLRTHQTRMDVIGNNIANVNTVGFKSTSVTFNDIMYQTTSGATQANENKGGVNAKQIGLGVNMGSTKISITSGGAAESTGNAFDIKLTDSNSTNFFVVKNAGQTLFTRAGSFYVDGNGNLAMTTTGYLVQGWQVNPETKDIQRDTVSPLRIMSPENMTSEPEATTNVTASGVIDKNDTNVTSSSGYALSVAVYDDLGYTYTAKFAIKMYDNTEPNSGKYTVELKNIYDDNNNDVLAQYLTGKHMKADNSGYEDNSIADIFGDVVTRDVKYKPLKSYEDKANTGTYNTGTKMIDFSDGSHATVQDVYGLTPENVDGYDSAGTISIDSAGNLKFSVKSAIGVLQYDTKDGTLSSVTDGTDIGKSMKLNLSMFAKDMKDVTEGGTTTQVPNTGLNSFSDIDVDFSKTLNYDNGGTSTLGLEKGSAENSAIGYGKKLGVLTGVSVDGTGRIYGSYDNGNTDLLGQICVAQFANASGLESLGENCYGQTINSGEFDGIGKDVSADGGSMSTGQLEMSNVDLSQEFTTMITTQRGFQANSRIISVSDSMLEELTNLKR